MTLKGKQVKMRRRSARQLGILCLVKSLDGIMRRRNGGSKINPQKL